MLELVASPERENWDYKLVGGNEKKVYSFGEGVRFKKGGSYYSVDTENAESREEAREELRRVTGQPWEWFKEETGLKHWVLYDGRQFEVVDEGVRFLKIRKEFTGFLEMPVGASSLWSMFKGASIRGLGPRFSGDGIVTLAHAFEGAHFGKKTVLSLGKGVVSAASAFKGAEVEGELVLDFDFGTVKDAREAFSSVDLRKIRWKQGLATSSLVGARGMFKGAVWSELPKNATFSHVTDWSETFAGVKFREGDRLVIDTREGSNFSGMFRGAEFPPVSSLDTRNGEDFTEMFRRATWREVNFPVTFNTKKARAVDGLFREARAERAEVRIDFSGAEKKRGVFRGSKGFGFGPEAVRRVTLAHRWEQSNWEEAVQW